MSLRDSWKPQFQSYPDIELEFGTDIRPVFGNGFDYNHAENKPRINGVELSGDKTNEELNIQSISNEDIENIIKKS